MARYLLVAALPLCLLACPADRQRNPMLTLATPDLPDALEGRAYTATFHAAGGNDASYGWEVVSGALPPGLSIQPSGVPSTVLSGTPTAAGTYPFTLQVTCADGARDCETMLVDWQTGVVYLVDKNHGGNVYRFPGTMDAAWTSGNPATLVHVKAGFAPGGNTTLTGGDASRDANRVVVRGYGSTCWEVSRPQGGTFDDIFDTTASSISTFGGQQYEAICYSADGTDLVTVTELSGGSTVPLSDSPADPGPYDTTIAGTPTAAGDYAFTVQVRDSAGNTATRTFTIRIP